MKDGAIYVRVSTEEQAREGYSIEAQIKAIKDYARKNNIFIDEKYIFKDEGISGREAEKRPAFMEMIKQAKSTPKKFDVILVHKFDRFSRNREDSVVYKSLLRKEYNINVISVCEPLDPDDKMSVIMEAFLEAMAEYYSLNLSGEVKKGQLEKHSKGELQTRPSYGYDVKENKLVINEKESKIVKYIFEQYTLEHIPMLSIARELSNVNIRNKNGNKFENRSLYYILNNPTYIGKLRYTPGRRDGYKFDDPNTIIVDGSHSPIISKELWNLTQMELAKNKKFGKPHQIIEKNVKNWLKGLVRCKRCGCTLVTCGKKKLRCNGYNKGKCDNSISINTIDTENLILEQIKNDFNSGIIKNIVPNKKENKTTNEYDLINSSILALDEKEERIKQSYINGIDTLEEYKQNKNLLMSEKKVLIEKLSKINKPNLKKHKQEIIENGKKVYEILTNEEVSVEEKYFIINRLINKVEFDSDNNSLIIFYN